MTRTILSPYYNCLNCGKTFTNKWKTPWSICYDPQYKENVWGGDSHNYVGYLCGKCGRMFDRKTKVLSKITEQKK